MPKRTDIKKIMIIGAGPIVIGQACEFDYSGVQACRALKDEGYEIILVNSNPATIMTDPNLADRTYIEPIKPKVIANIIAKEKPCAILPTMGGQTSLNVVMELAKQGVLKAFGVELIGANAEAIDKAEDREKFRKLMHKINLSTPDSTIAHTLDEAKIAQKKYGFPVIIRPSFTLGGAGGGIAYNIEEFESICQKGLQLSPTSELLIEQSILGWKEYELEVVRDKNDNAIIICSIENIDPMGIHTGDSITVAPAQTLTDKEYQLLRNAAIKVLRAVGVETGGSNVQFAVNPVNGDLIVIEMNPRVSRSSALASKATGFPIAKVAAKLAVGYTLDELKNEITGGVTPASFEPSLDYVVTKIPRFDFEKFPKASGKLTTQMQSVGEAMAIGRTFKSSLQKALRSLEIGHNGFEPIIDIAAPDAKDKLSQELISAGPHRLWYVADAFRFGLSLETVFQKTRIDPWFLQQIHAIVTSESKLLKYSLRKLDKEFLLKLKQDGFSDHRIASLIKNTEHAVQSLRHEFNIHPVYHRIDSTAAEFASPTAYLYSSYDTVCEAKPSNAKKMMILGGGPNRIGQGIEFDYCCVHAVMALKDAGYETIMVNCNPETVSTDYDIADKLYFEALTLEDVYEIILKEKPTGIIVQYGGQTPLKLSQQLVEYNVPIIGTSCDAIDRAENRDRFQQFIQKLNLKQPLNAIASSVADGVKSAKEIGYPVMLRPSYVLGGRAMEIVFNEDDLKLYLTRAFILSSHNTILIDKYLEDAIEIDADCICDGNEVFVAGIMQHIEQAGVHSGDSSCSLPPYNLSDKLRNEIEITMQKMALELDVVGLMNAQFAIYNNEVYVLELNPRASRTVPFVSKAIGIPLAKVGALCMAGISLAEQGINTKYKTLNFFAVKEAVFPFTKFQGVDPILGPEMKSTGEVMGLGETFAQAFSKTQCSSGNFIPRNGCIFISVKDSDKNKIIDLARGFIAKGFNIIATHGTALALEAEHIPCQRVNKVAEGRPHVVDKIINNEIAYIVNTTEGRYAIEDSCIIRESAIQAGISYTTTINGANAALKALDYLPEAHVYCLQDLVY